MSKKPKLTLLRRNAKSGESGLFWKFCRHDGTSFYPLYNSRNFHIDYEDAFLRKKKVTPLTGCSGGLLFRGWGPGFLHASRSFVGAWNAVKDENFLLKKKYSIYLVSGKVITSFGYSSSSFHSLRVVKKFNSFAEAKVYALKTGTYQ